MSCCQRFTLGAASAVLFCGLAVTSPATAQVLDEPTIDAACADNALGPALRAQCAIFDIDTPTRTAAATGNNMGIAGGTGRGKTDVRDRLEALRESDEEEAGGGQAADWEVGKLSIFVSADGSSLDRDTSVNEIGHDTVTAGATLGIDWRFSDALVGGMAVSYSYGDTDFRAGAGGMETDSYSTFLFASYAPDDIVYFDAYVGYGIQKYEGKRNIAFVAAGVPVAATARSDPDGYELSGGVSAAADFALGALTLGPHAQVDYVRTKVLGYTENGGAGFAAAFGDQTIKSLQTVLGAHVSYAGSTDWGVVVPYARLDWVHELEDDARSVPVTFLQAPNTPFVALTDKATRNFGRATVGLSALWPGGWAAFADLQHEFGVTYEEAYRFTMGFRKEL